jgi:hypothetical protein
MMETKTLAIVAVMIAATAAFAMVPFFSASANAAPNGDVKTTCFHNGNGANKCGPGNSSTEVKCVKTRGKYVCS